MDMLDATAEAGELPRSLVCHYNPTVVTAALVVSLLGAFTSTQLMSQARSARSLPGILVWTVLGCVVFGFCGTWCLHFLGMLSCEFDVPIGLNPLLTVLSAVLAVSFTFGALSTDVILKFWRRPRPKKGDVERHASTANDHLGRDLEFRESSEPLLRPSLELPQAQNHENGARKSANGKSHITPGPSRNGTAFPYSDIGAAHLASQRMGNLHMSENVGHLTPPLSNPNQSDYDGANGNDTLPVPGSHNRRSLESILSEAEVTETNSRRSSLTGEQTAPASNTLLFAVQAIIKGLTLANLTKGFVWSLALTNMHFMGVKALEIPGGYVAIDPARLILCALISWSVCSVGVILMAGMEVNIKQQVLFSVVGASGVAAVHFSGMYACSFWSTEPPSSKQGYPTELPVVIASVAILTCMASTGLLAHSATKARDKLAEVLYTRKRLWAAIAQKENAEAVAAAKSEFIASASHEIRTPLHQLQGYADLLSKSRLSEQDRQLLLAIQHATRSLSMITSNVLDWSRLEKGEAICRPVPVDIRLACEAVVHVLPNNEENTETELIVAVAPEVPLSVIIDETYLQRILMNLLSNSFKFTASGYVMLLLRLKNGVLHITVADTGTGIPKSFLPQLFEPYKQVQARGAERGTGLGLSITKRLVQQMQGSVAVESKYQHDQGVGIANSGSVFTLTIPIANTETSPDPPPPALGGSVQVVIMHDGKRRDIEGIVDAWTSFGAEVSRAQATTDFPSGPNTIIWADLSFLQKHLDVCVTILRQRQHLVLVPYKDRTLLDEVLGPTPSSYIVPIRKPLIWHLIVQKVIDAQEGRSTADHNNHIELVPESEIVNNSVTESTKQDRPAKKRVVLLVEDNKINQTLGAKMLTMLNYDVLLAEDGQEALEIVMEHAQTLDAILMDQSMPRKDGITATREIREMEAAGILPKRQIIIAVTAAAGPEAQALFLEAGTDMFLSKPLSLAKLERTLSHYFDG